MTNRLVTYRATPTASPVTYRATPAPIPVVWEASIAAAILSVDSASINATADFAAASFNRTITLSNTGDGPADYSVADDTAWLSVSPASGTLAAGGSQVLTFAIDPDGLASDAYSATATITAAGATNSPLIVTVSLTVAFTPAELTGVTAWTGKPGEGLTLIDGTKVSQWTTPLGNDFTQTTDAARPIYDSLNQRIDFTFPGDYLTGGTGWDQSSYYLGVVVAPRVAISSNYRQPIVGFGPSTNARAWLVFGGTAATDRVEFLANGNGDNISRIGWATGGTLPAGTAYFIEVLWQAGVMTLFANGAQVATLSNSEIKPGVVVPTTEFRIGQRAGSNLWQDTGDIEFSELIVGTTRPTGAERDSLIAYLSSRVTTT